MNDPAKVRASWSLRICSAYLHRYSTKLLYLMQRFTTIFDHGEGICFYHLLYMHTTCVAVPLAGTIT